jgi:ABC-type transport system substrate-binding protein
MMDPAAARAAYREVAQMVKDSGWYIPVVNDTAPIVMRDCVENFPHVSDWQTGFVAQVWLSCD